MVSTGFQKQLKSGPSSVQNLHLKISLSKCSVMHWRGSKEVWTSRWEQHTWQHASVYERYHHPFNGFLGCSEVLTRTTRSSASSMIQASRQKEVTVRTCISATLMASSMAYLCTRIRAPGSVSESLSPRQQKREGWTSCWESRRAYAVKLSKSLSYAQSWVEKQWDWGSS